MKSVIIKELSDSELKERLSEELIQLNKLKLNHAVSPLENPMKINSLRKTVARLNTELNRRILDQKSK